MILKNNSVTKLIKGILLTGVFLYIPFIFGKILLVYPDWGYDTYNSYLPQYELIVNKLLSGNFSLMDFTYGMGTNAFDLQSFLFDPFSIIPVLYGLVFGAKNVAYAIVYMQLMKSIVAGIGCYYYLSEFNFSKKSINLVSYIYAFSGYMIGAGQHYMFATVPVFLIFVLLFIEKSLKDKRFLPALALIIALTSCFSVFFVFHILIFSGIYTLIRTVQIIDKITFTGIIKKFFPCILFLILGLMLSGAVFLPSLYQIVGVSARTSAESLFTRIISSFILTSKEDLKMNILRFFSENMQGTVNSWNGGPHHFGAAHNFFSVVLILCIPQYIINSFSKKAQVKQKVIKSIIICVSLFSITNYFFGYLSNVFSTYNWRYTYVFLPLFCIVVADTLDKVFLEKRFNRYANVASIFISAILIAVYHDRGSGLASKIIVINALGCLIILAFILDIVATYNGNNNRVTKITFLLVFGCIAFNLFIDHAITLYAGRAFLTKDQLSGYYHEKNVSDIVSYLNNKEKNNFYRLERDFNRGTPVFVYSYMERYRSVSTYNSTLNKNSIEFVKNIGNANLGIQAEQQSYFGGSFGEKFDILMTDILGIKYLASTNKIDRVGWIFEQQFGDLFLYRNEDLDSAGHLYEKYITADGFAALSAVEKKLFPAECIILSEKPKSFNQVSKIEYANIPNALDFNNITFPNAWIDSIPQVGEIFGSSWQDGSFDIPINTNFTYNDNQQNVLKFMINPNQTFDLRVVFDLGKGFEVNQQVDFSQKIYSDTDNVVVIKIPSNTKAVRLIFAQATVHIFDMEILTKQKLYTNEGIILENPNFGDIVSGEVNAQKNSLMYIPIPYEKGWKAYIDGQEAEIMQANFGFSALEIKEGKHEVYFEYTAPWLLSGSVLSGIALFIIIFIYVFNKKEKAAKFNDVRERL